MAEVVSLALLGTPVEAAEFATFDGVTDDSIGIGQARVEAELKGVPLRFPPLTCVISDPTALTFTTTERAVLLGTPGASIVKARDGALMPTMASTQVGMPLLMSGVILDGNRVNNGVIVAGASYLLYFQGSNTYIVNSGFKNGRVGIACNVGISNFWLMGCTITNNFINGLIGPLGIRPGISGSPTATKFYCIGNFWDSNYSALAADSCAFQWFGVESLIMANAFRNNFNINGGQFALADGTSNPKTDLKGKIYRNDIYQDVPAPPGTATYGIEVDGGGCHVRYNKVRNSSGPCLTVAGETDGTVVEDNDFAVDPNGIVASSAIQFIQGATGLGVRSGRVVNNIIRSTAPGGAGIFVQVASPPNNLVLSPNTFDPSILEQIRQPT